MEWLQRLLRWLSGGSTGAPAPSNPPGRPGRRVEDYVRLLDGHPGLRGTTVRLLGGRATDDNVLFGREHIETEDDAGNAVQVDAFDTRTCGFGHILSESCHAAGLCGICGELLCSTERPTPCTSICGSCGIVCCTRHRRTRDLGDGEVITYCSRCSWRYWFW